MEACAFAPAWERDAYASDLHAHVPFAPLNAAVDSVRCLSFAPMQCTAM